MYLKMIVPFVAVILAVASAGLVGGPVDADMSEEGAQSALQFAMAQYNRQSNDAFVSQVSEVIKVQKQVVSGLKYIFTVKVGRTSLKLFQTTLMNRPETSPPDHPQHCRPPLPYNSSGFASVSCNVSQIRKFCGKQTAVKKEPASFSSGCQEEEVYSMQTNPRGVCLIIDCVGTEGDQLEQTFKALHFHVIIHKLLSVRDMLSTLREAARQRGHYRASAFVCCIISRSRSSDLLATDSHSPGLSLDTVRRLFASDSCPGLAGKPKLFFIQSYEVCEGCVGCGRQEDGELETDGPVSSCRLRTVPADADVFWSHCETKAEQLEMPNHQSVYLRALRSSLTEGQKRRTHLVDMHMAVNRAVYDHNSKSAESSYLINLRHTLRKNVYLS